MDFQTNLSTLDMVTSYDVNRAKFDKFSLWFIHEYIGVLVVIVVDYCGATQLRYNSITIDRFERLYLSFSHSIAMRF